MHTVNYKRVTVIKEKKKRKGKKSRNHQITAERVKMRPTQKGRFKSIFFNVWHIHTCIKLATAQAPFSDIEQCVSTRCVILGTFLTLWQTSSAPLLPSSQPLRLRLLRWRVLERPWNYRLLNESLLYLFNLRMFNDIFILL